MPYIWPCLHPSCRFSRTWKCTKNESRPVSEHCAVFMRFIHTGSSSLQSSGTNRDLPLEFTTAGKPHWHDHRDRLLKPAHRSHILSSGNAGALNPVIVTGLAVHRGQKQAGSWVQGLTAPGVSYEGDIDPDPPQLAVQLYLWVCRDVWLAFNFHTPSRHTHARTHLSALRGLIQ